LIKEKSKIKHTTNDFKLIQFLLS